jgi:2-methylisocitrate lyase-like PEP mutase family enzyme
MSPEIDDLVAKAEVLRSLHRGPGALVLPNAWDVASARLVTAAGFPAIATPSGAIAQSLGYDDNDSMPIDDAFGVVARIAAAIDVPVTADVEAGYGLSPRDLVGELLRAGAVGYNLEDTDHHGAGPLVEADAQAERLAELKIEARAKGVDLVLNARVDVFRYAEVNARSIEEALRRAHLYIDAGADCIFPIRLADETVIRNFVAALPVPINILLRPDTPPISRLIELGVARISLGGGLFRTAYTAARDELRNLSHQVLDPS